ncbi:MAG: hypothetical protein XD93_0155 [candidate division WS6 bacterium 34_10]|jgi:hypothetical protein|uniref:Uncharacterized protein n=1 Tax=candidate division WS6 bacterium 34_10 TaxID=1641389 RepID=A0A101HJ49_9BACT|nr:MAG: hypothetical protein XD93_0155 [candidate division WS6 bacterium 34_10]
MQGKIPPLNNESLANRERLSTGISDTAQLETVDQEKAEQSRAEEVLELIKELNECPPGKGKIDGKAAWRAFEELSEKSLTLILKNDFKDFRINPQAKDEDVIHDKDEVIVIDKRKDLVIPIGAMEAKTSFFKQLSDGKKYKYERLVIDCKNTEKLITADDLLQMFSYMEAPNTSIGIFLSRGKKEKKRLYFDKIPLSAKKKFKDLGYPILVFDEQTQLEWFQAYIKDGNSNGFISKNIVEKVAK